MQSQDKYRIAILSAYALSLHGFESMLPTPIPWLRFGLANIITLTALILYGLRFALTVTLIRVILSSLLFGTFLGPAFILSLGGGLSSTVAMGMVSLLCKDILGPVGLSLIGAVFHNLAQLAIAQVLFIQRIEAIILVAPFILLIGTITGFANGIVSDILVRNLAKKAA